ncbi:adenylosuccinate lyase [Campylobacter sp. faydin G-140]|nr:adenylosuccinate lyase [Campylobacter anatolicus]
MNIMHTLESLSIQTTDDVLFRDLRDMINKNFKNNIANKGKVIAFYEESEIPQRKCFVKFIKKLYEKQSGKSLNLNFAEYKTIKLNYIQKNAISSVLNIEVDFLRDEVIFTLNETPKIFTTYLMQKFKNNATNYNHKLNKLSVKVALESDFDVLGEFLAKKEHMKFIVHFDFDMTDFERFKHKFKVQNSSKFINRFSALASMLEENFEILGCDKNDSFDEIRESYLKLVKIYHPDRHANKTQKIQEQYRANFEKIQNAYEALKPFYKNQEAFVSA